MKILITIPHAFLGPNGTERRTERNLYGSESNLASERAAALLRCVSALHQNFGANQRLIGPADMPCNPDHASITIVVCTAGDQHLVGHLPPGLVHHHATTMHPRLLGFACHALLKANLGSFDWYGYVEDDIELTDSMFFDKLAWFNAAFGPKALLQPNRFEVSTGPVPKLYIDGPVLNDASTGAFQDVSLRPRMIAPALGRSLVFQKTTNPHSGCFFADRGQMAAMADHPEYGQFTTAFSSPLESAATLPILRCFDVYKPAPENASFLEVRHIDQRMLDVVVQYTRQRDGLAKHVSEIGA
ncbi:calcium-binding protein [Acidisphaera sp. L21]|uniref:calcium-binding protein n=1 Tax=Acidisphaera sp. L21 TaxID=1641851 RepID=UPI00131BB45B|nr:calcium-binding protein [Acidisphaera sp. L21]